MERQTEEYFARIQAMGGVLKGIEENFFQREIQASAYAYQKTVEEKRKIIVGVNEYRTSKELWDIPVFKIDPSCEREQKAKLKRLKKNRSTRKVLVALDALKRKAETKENLMPYILRAVEVYSTLGEITGTLKEVFGEYQEPGAV